MGGILEVDGDNAAHGAGSLIHQTAGLAEEHILGKLTDLGNFDLIQQLHIVAVVLAAQDGTHADLKGGGAGQPGAAQHAAGGVAVKAAHLAAGIQNALGNAADEGGRMLRLVGLGRQDGKIHIINFFKAVGLHTDDVFLVGGNHRHNVQVDRACQNHTVVVVGVVAADFGTTGR